MVFGRNNGDRGGPQAGARRAAPPDGGARGGSGAPERGEQQGGQSAWQKTVDLYDSWHSSLELGIKVEFFKSLLTFAMAPVEKGKEGDAYEIRAGEKRYNRDDSLMAVLKPEDAIVFLALLDNFMAGSIRQAILPLGREEGKRLVLAYADSYYQPGDAWFEALEGSMVFSIERDASDSGRTPVDEKVLVFFCRPRAFVLDDTVADEATGLPAESALYPEMMVLAEFVRGYIRGLPRQDFASVRLLERGPGGRASSSESSSPQPRRLNSAPGAGARPGLPAPGAAAPQAPGRQEGAVSQQDVEAALDAGAGLDKRLGDDTPSF
jgi:hypothetical protein